MLAMFLQFYIRLTHIYRQNLTVLALESLLELVAWRLAVMASQGRMRFGVGRGGLASAALLATGTVLGSLHAILYYETIFI